MRILLFAQLGVQKVKSASDWSIAVPRAPGNTSMHSNDARKQAKIAMAEGSVSSANYFLHIFSGLSQSKSRITKNSRCEITNLTRAINPKLHC